MEKVNTVSILKTRTQGSGFELVFLHGWGTNQLAFNNFLSCFYDEYRVTTLDLPGYCENSNLVPSPYSLDAICHLLAQLITTKCCLIGWSLGGLIAQRFAVLYPERLQALVCIASTPQFLAERGWPGMQEKVLNNFSYQLKHNYQRTLERFLVIQSIGSDSARADIKGLKATLKAMLSSSQSALVDGLGLLKTTDLRDQIGRISCPTLRLYGRQDTLVPVSAVDYIHALHPQSDNVVVAGAAHAPFISHQDSCAQIVHRFLYSVTSSK